MDAIPARVSSGPSDLSHLLSQRRLVRSRIAHIPGLDHHALCLVQILFVFDVLHADFDAISGEDDVLLVHARLGRRADLLSAHVDVVEDEAADANDDDEDDEGEELHEERSIFWWFAPRHCEVGCDGCLLVGRGRK
jgi:hypothetical protein